MWYFAPFFCFQSSNQNKNYFLGHPEMSVVDMCHFICNMKLGILRISQHRQKCSTDSNWYFQWATETNLNQNDQGRRSYQGFREEDYSHRIQTVPNYCTKWRVSQQSWVPGDSYCKQIDDLVKYAKKQSDNVNGLDLMFKSILNESENLAFCLSLLELKEKDDAENIRFGFNS